MDSEDTPLLDEDARKPELYQSLPEYDETVFQGPGTKDLDSANNDNDDEDSSVDTFDETGCCNPHRTVYRYVMLIFICLVGVGDYFCQDGPAALQGHMLRDLDISVTEYMGFYSALQWAGIVSSLVGGYLIDRVFGMRWGVVCFSLMITIAQGLFAGSAMLQSYWLMYGSRIIYGLVYAGSALATDNITIKWFKSRELNAVMGLRTSIPRASSYVNMNVLGPIYTYFRSQGAGETSLGLSFLVGAGVCFFSFLSACVLGFIDYQGDQQVPDKASKDTHEKKEPPRLSDIKEFSVSYWLVTLVTCTYYLAIFPFVGLGLVYYEMKYEKSPNVAGNLNGLVYLLSAILLPVFGLVVDKVGHNLLWLLASIVLSIASHVLFAFTFVDPHIPTAMLGLGYSLFTATDWPLVAYMVDPKLLATAYGILNATLWLGQAGGTYFCGYIVDTVGYFTLELYFILCHSVALFLAVILFLIESTKDDSEKAKEDKQIRV